MSSISGTGAPRGRRGPRWWTPARWRAAGAVRDGRAVEPGGTPGERVVGAPPPPFHHQRLASRLLVSALVLMLVGTAAASALLTVPTFASARAVVVSAQDGGRGVRLLVRPGLRERLQPGAPVRLQVPGLPADTHGRLGRVGPAQDVAALAAGLGVPAAAAQQLTGRYLPVTVDGIDGAPRALPGAVGTAVARIGHRPLAALFVGRSLVVDQ